MGVFSIVDLLYLLCRITIIQFATVRVTSCNPTASRLYPEFSSILFPSNEQPGLSSSTKIEKDNNFSFKNYNSPELLIESKEELRKCENPNPFTNLDASLIVPDNSQRTFTPLSTKETSSIQYDTTKTIIKNSNLMQELLNRMPSSVVSNKDVVTQSNLQATQKPLTIQSSKHQAQYPTSVPSLLLNKLPEYSFNYTSPMISNNLLNKYNNNQSNKVLMPQTDNVVTNNFSEDHLISNSCLLKTPTLLPNIGPRYSVPKANIPVIRDTNSLRINKNVSNVCMPVSNFIGLAIPKQNPPELKSESTNLSFDNPTVLPNIESPSLINKDCFPIIKDSNSFKLPPAVEREFIKPFSTTSSKEIYDIQNLKKNRPGFNRDIIDTTTTTNITPVLHKDTEILDVSDPSKFLPNWQITQKVFQCDNSKRQNQPLTVPLVNVKNSFVTNTPNLPVLDIKTQKEIGAIIPKKDILYPTKNRKDHCTKEGTNKANKTPVTETENNQLSLSNQITGISNVIVPRNPTINLFDNSRVLIPVIDKSDLEKSVNFTDSQSRNIYEPKLFTDTSNTPLTVLNSLPYVPHSRYLLESPTQQSSEAYDMPKASNFAINSNTPPSLPTNTVFKTNYNYYTDYLSNFLDNFLPAITTSIISAFLGYNFPKQSEDSCTPPIENTSWILSKVYSKPIDIYCPPKAIVNSIPLPIIEPSGALSALSSESTSLKTVNSETLISPLETTPFLNSESLLFNNAANKLLSPAIAPVINTCGVLQTGFSEISILNSSIIKSIDSVSHKLSETPMSLPMPISDIPPLPKETWTPKPLLGLPWKDTSAVVKLSENVSHKSITESSMPYIASITVNVMPPKNTPDHIVIVV